MRGLGGADDGAHPAQRAEPSPARRSASPSTSAARRSCSGASGAGRSCDVGGARDCWCGPGRRPRRRPPRRRRRSGSSASTPSSGLAVKASAPSPATGAPGRRRLADQRLGVGRGGDRHVAALAVGDHQQARLAGGGADLGERRPAGRAEALEAGELRLDRDAGRAGLLDQRAGSGRRRRRPRPRPACPRPSGPSPPRSASPGRGRDRGRPGCGAPRRAPQAGPRKELQAAQPLTLVFSAEPAEKRGTLPPGIVIRSPVRGLTPWRGPRSATWNLPKPVKLTSPPPAQRRR